MKTFQELIKMSQKMAKELGLKRSDVKKIIKKVRREAKVPALLPLSTSSKPTNPKKRPGPKK